MREIKRSTTDWRAHLEPMLIEMDPPRHTELRTLVSRAFTPRRVADLEGPTRALAVELSEGFGPGGRVDVIGDFAAKLPMAVISVMLGVPRADQDELREWSDAMLHREEGSAEKFLRFLQKRVKPAALPGDVAAFAAVASALAALPEGLKS